MSTTTKTADRAYLLVRPNDGGSRDLLTRDEADRLLADSEVVEATAQRAVLRRPIGFCLLIASHNRCEGDA